MPSVMERIAAARGKSADEAGFYWWGGPVEVAERTWFISNFSGITAFETDEGIVLVDSGMERLAPGLAALLRERTQAPIHTAIFTHGHVDHAYGLQAFLIPGQPRPRIVAQRAILDRFARYEQTAGFNAGINARQFGGIAESAAGDAYDSFKRPALMPDMLFEERLSLSVGGMGFELFHCRGETDDGVWVWCPDRKVLCPGDLVINAVPNAGNPQKVQRYPWDWADGLRRMAALDAVSLCPGHGGPVVQDPAKVKRILLDSAGYLESILRRTLAAMNDGAPPHVDIVQRVTPPPSDAPWLRPIYDEAEFIVRNIIRFYGGWWSGRPSELKPAPRLALAREIAEAAGGAAALLERARKLAADGDMRLAGHFADYALEAAPEDPAIRDGVAVFYEARAQGETGLMAENLFHAAAAYARAGKPFG
ncbi:MAG TPA: alkyl sulfatase dimerization domain-containing protein [Aliidongia sp.]|nr:alkyl sulfatase dimerization domain-containing protein [Aliidongia sp.]